MTAPLSTQPTVPSTGLQPEPLLSELSRPGAPGHQLPELDVPEVDDLGGQVLRLELPLPEVGELVRASLNGKGGRPIKVTKDAKDPLGGG